MTTWRKTIRRQLLAKLDIDGVYLTVEQAKILTRLASIGATHQRLTPEEFELLSKLLDRAREWT